MAQDAAKLISHYLGVSGKAHVISHDWGAMVHWLLMHNHADKLHKNSTKFL